MKRMLMMTCLFLFLMAPFAGAATVTFENLDLSSNPFWNGSDESGGFISGDTYFQNGYNTAWGSWDGWAYSNMTDTSTPGYGNQYSAITGSGVGGSANYGVAYDGGAWGLASPPTLSFGASTGEDYNTTISGAYFTNTTYAYLSMLNGDGFVTAFDTDDYQKLIIKGITAEGTYTTETVEFFLADFTNGNSYIVSEWTWVDLTSLGDVIGLELDFEGSQIDYVPAYVAMDNLNGSAPVPVPGAFLLLGSGMLGLAAIRRNKG